MLPLIPKDEIIVYPIVGYAMFKIAKHAYELWKGMRDVRAASIDAVVTSQANRNEIRGGIDKALSTFAGSVSLQEIIYKCCDHKNNNERMITDSKFEQLRAELKSMSDSDEAWKLQHAGQHSEQSQSIHEMTDAIKEMAVMVGRIDERTGR